MKDMGKIDLLEVKPNWSVSYLQQFVDSDDYVVSFITVCR